MGWPAAPRVLRFLEISPFKSKENPVDLYNEAITRVSHISPSSFPSRSDNYSSPGGATVRVVREAQVICVELVEHSKSQSQSAIMVIV